MSKKIKIIITIISVFVFGFQMQGAEKVSKNTLPNKVATAIQSNDVKTVKKYLDDGGDVEARFYHYRDGESPLLLATSHDRPDIVTLLLQYNANVNSRGRSNRSALHESASKIFGQSKIRKMLFLADADIEAKDNDGKTPLLEAAYTGNLGMVKWLLKNGAKINATDKKNKTALEVAAIAHGRLSQYMSMSELRNFQQTIEYLEDVESGKIQIPPVKWVPKPPRTRPPASSVPVVMPPAYEKLPADELPALVAPAESAPNFHAKSY